jgi:hypothetical protein
MNSALETTRSIQSNCVVSFHHRYQLRPLQDPTIIRTSAFMCGKWAEQVAQMETRSARYRTMALDDELRAIRTEDPSTKRQTSGSNSRGTLRRWNGKELIFHRLRTTAQLEPMGAVTGPLITASPTNYRSRRRCCIESRASCDAHRRPTPAGNPIEVSALVL